jgi:hypothetical protein
MVEKKDRKEANLRTELAVNKQINALSVLFASGEEHFTALWL